MGAEVPGPIHEVAVFDKNRVLVDVKEVKEGDYVTDSKRRQMKLPPGHDVRELIGRYRVSPDYEALEPVPEKLSVDRILLFSWYHSQGLITWAQIEDLLYRVFCGLLRCEQRSAAAVFYSLMHFNQKLKTTDAIAKFALEGAALKSWIKLQKRLWQANEKRNSLAHHGSMWVTAEGGEVKQTLAPSVYAAVPQPGTMLQRKELEDTLRNFQKLHRDLDSYAEQCNFARPVPHGLVALIEALRSQGDSD